MSVGVFLVEARKIHEEIRAHHIIVARRVPGWPTCWGPPEKGGGHEEKKEKLSEKPAFSDHQNTQKNNNKITLVFDCC